MGIHLNPDAVDHFKGLAEETGLPHQKLIDLHVLDCAKKRKKLMMKWVASRRATNELGLDVCATCQSITEIVRVSTAHRS